MMLAFIIWLLMSIAFIGLGIYCFISKKEVAFGFWANAEMFPVNNVKAYNKALGKLWCVFGGCFAVLGIPLLKGQNSPFIFVSVVGTMFLTIATMVVYVLVIEKKYREKGKKNDG